MNLDTPSILYRDIGGAKQLCCRFTFILPKDFEGFARLGFISVKGSWCEVWPGYTWDGASGPTIDTPDSVCASLGHDVMYELMGAGVLPKDFKEGADYWFYERLLKDGMPQLRALYWYKAVRVFGVPGFSKDMEVKTAPRPGRETLTEIRNPFPGHFA